MTDVLSRIVARKRVDVTLRLAGRPVDARPTHRSLRMALARPGGRFIMEVKRSSPSGHDSPYTAAVAAAAYAPVADAISVLVDGPDFGGSLDDLRTVRQRFDGPILAKDFIVDATQVSEARAAGADAILIMMSVLDDIRAEEVRAEADRLGMDAIYEVHDDEEVGRAIAHGAQIVGINNRDLQTLRIDLANTERMSGLLPSDVIILSESGIRSRTDVERLAPHADAFLVGSSLMASPDIFMAARALVYGNTKICGLTRMEDVELVSESGATHAGFVLVPATPRALDPLAAGPLIAEARALGLKTVGVFRNQALDQVAAVAAATNLDVVQLHGQEPPRYIRTLRGRLAKGSEIWGACPVGTTAARSRSGCDRTLFDTSCGGTSGGMGQAFAWDRVARRRDLPNAFLAGGIGPHNVRAAAAVGTFGLDVGSGVEAAPGVKDPAKMRALFGARRVLARGDGE